MDMHGAHDRLAGKILFSGAPGFVKP